MDRLAFVAMAAINEQRTARHMLSNELANVSTIGFQRSYEAAMRTVKVEGPGFDSRFKPVVEQRDWIMLEGGARMATGRKLDIALDGDSVLGVSAKNGDLAFTRRGDLRVNAAGVLENGSGFAVRGAAGPITVPVGFDIDIAPDGAVYASDPNLPNEPPQLVANLLLRDATGIRLERRTDGLFKPAGEAIQENGDFAGGPVPPSVSVGVLEGSNVSAVEAMVKLIEQSRSFEMNVRIIKETKDLDESGATMIRGSR
jgi:flagellar basal-body rod protein FlgF